MEILQRSLGTMRIGDEEPEQFIDNQPQQVQEAQVRFVICIVIAERVRGQVSELIHFRTNTGLKLDKVTECFGCL